MLRRQEYRVHPVSFLLILGDRAECVRFLEPEPVIYHANSRPVEPRWIGDAGIWPGPGSSISRQTPMIYQQSVLAYSGTIVYPLLSLYEESGDCRSWQIPDPGMGQF